MDEGDRLFDLTNRSALVTGASRGLGLAIARAFAAAGARVMIASENGPECEDARGKLADEGLSVSAMPCDVADASQLADLVSGTVDAFGRLDVLVANAGISDAMTGSTVIEEETYDRVMAINLHSIVRLCALAVPHMKEAGGGSIILMSSLAALRGNGRLGPYALTKAALAQLARNLAVEHGPANIRANAIAPGFIRTDLAAPLLADADFMKRRIQMTPLRRPGEPHEVAGAAMFLASAAGGFVTGQTLVVDGGTLITDGS